ncbi:hypothetical protein ACX9MO_13385 [Pseudooceanicola sp. 502str34]
MFRKVASAGFIDRHRRGRTTVSGAVRGYAQFLLSGAERSDANASQSRSHRAKAEKIRRATARRRRGLVECGEVEAVIDMTVDRAVERLRAVDLGGLIDGPTAETFAAEVEAAVARIGAARDRAVADLWGEEVGDDG